MKPTVIEQIHAAITRRLLALSSNRKRLDKAKPLYDKALRASGFNESLHYCKKNTTTSPKRNRKGNIIWFNPPYRMSKPKSLKTSSTIKKQ